MGFSKVTVVLFNRQIAAIPKQNHHVNDFGRQGRGPRDEGYDPISPSMRVDCQGRSTRSPAELLHPSQGMAAGGVVLQATCTVI